MKKEIKHLSIEYFIEKFKKIPADKIGSGSIMNHCALFHCGAGMTKYSQSPESRELADHFRCLYQSMPVGEEFAFIYFINDATQSQCYIDSTGRGSRFRRALLPLLPKERIVLALQIVKYHRDRNVDIITAINKIIEKKQRK